MSKQAIVVGLGHFGMALAETLTQEGVEVIAVDHDGDRVQLASDFAAQALRMDATDEAALASLNPADRDFVVCSIGADSREGAILVTALLRQLGAPHIIARASDELMARILRLVGAHDVVQPERAFGERYARRLLHSGIVDEIPFGKDLLVSELPIRPLMVGRTLMELDLPGRFGLTVLGVQTSRNGKETVLLPDPRRPFDAEDTLLVVGRPGAAQALNQAW